MSYGPNPWQQTQWDWRAAGNFACGSAGGGLIACAALSGAEGSALSWLLLIGMALIGVGLTCVWLEIGRPLRALHVFFNPRTSWMTREAFVAALLMPVTFATALWLPGLVWLAAALALAFVYCQSRMLNASRGIPAWREPLMVPLMLCTGLADGAALLAVFGPASQAQGRLPWALLGVLLAVRYAVGWFWYGRLAASLRARALAPVKQARLAYDVGSLLPLAIVLAATVSPAAASKGLLVLAGTIAVAGGMLFKFLLITRASFNQGFALSHLPVRGQRH